ncbi:MAG: hypothetical protein AAGE99_00415 [Chlamydiota bacterium]
MLAKKVRLVSFFVAERAAAMVVLRQKESDSCLVEKIVGNLADLTSSRVRIRHFEYRLPDQNRQHRYETEGGFRAALSHVERSFTNR